MKSTPIKNMLGRAVAATMLLMMFVVIAVALAINLSPGLARYAEAAVTNYPPGVAVYATPIQISGTYTTTTTPVRYKLPYAGRLIGFSAQAQTVSGTITVDFQAGGSSLLSSPITLLSSGVVVEGTITTSAVADEAELTAVISGSGGPSVTDLTILPTFLRR